MYYLHTCTCMHCGSFRMKSTTIRSELPFYVVYHMFVVSDTGVKGQCLQTFLVRPLKNAVWIFWVFNFCLINIFVLTKFDFGITMGWGDSVSRQLSAYMLVRFVTHL